MGILSQEQIGLLTEYDAASSYSTAFYTLYANIRFNRDNAELQQQTVLFATPSAYPLQGAVVANIAIAAAQHETPTIAVDADIYAPSFQQRFGLEGSAGLTDLLSGASITAQTVAAKLQPTFLPNLRVLCAGRPLSRGTNALLSSNLSAIIAGLREVLVDERQSGMIIFHAPPVLEGADALAIGAQVDQTYLTIAAGSTRRSQARQAQDQLQHAHARLIGVILLDM